MIDRLDLVNRVKEKILDEVAIRKRQLSLTFLNTTHDELLTPEYESLLKEIILCSDVTKFINQEKRFMQIINYAGSIPIYAINDSMLQMWLLDDFNWLSNFSYMLRDAKIMKEPFCFISDRDLQFNLVSVIEEAILQKKLK